MQFLATPARAQWGSASDGNMRQDAGPLSPGRQSSRDNLGSHQEHAGR